MITESWSRVILRIVGFFWKLLLQEWNEYPDWTNLRAFPIPATQLKFARKYIWIFCLFVTADHSPSCQNNNTQLCGEETEVLHNWPCSVWHWWLWWPGDCVTMQTLEYLVIISGVLFSFTFFWLLTVVGVFDCLRTSPIKSAFHCLGLITAQSEQALADSRTRLRHKQINQNHSTSCSNQLLPYTV